MRDYYHIIRVCLQEAGSWSKNGNIKISLIGLKKVEKLQFFIYKLGDELRNNCPEKANEIVVYENIREEVGLRTLENYRPLRNLLEEVRLNLKADNLIEALKKADEMRKYIDNWAEAAKEGEKIYRQEARKNSKQVSEVYRKET